MTIKSEKGVSAVEFALIAPLLFFLTFGIVEFALLLFDKAVVTNASREGARAAIVYHVTGPDLDDYAPLTVLETQKVVTDYANGYLVNLGQPGGNNLVIPPDVTYESGSPVSGEDVTVTVTYTYDFLVFPDLTTLIGGTFDGTINLIGTTVMRME
jgi:Flp pilus assembly protein TadG